MGNNTVKIQNIKMVKNLKIIVQNVYCNSYYLNCKQTHITAIHICFHGYVPVYDTQTHETPAVI